MMFVDFEEANITLTKPPSMTDEQCSDVKALRAVDNDGFGFFLVCVMPSKEDKEAIAAGRPLFLKVCGESFPPVAMFTMDDKGNANV